MSEVSKGVTAIIPVRTLATTGLPVTPTTGPSIERILVNGVSTTVAGASLDQQTDAEGAPVVGWYNLSVPTNDMSYNDQVQVIVLTVIEGVPLEKPYEFSVSSDATLRPQLL